VMIFMIVLKGSFMTGNYTVTATNSSLDLLDDASGISLEFDRLHGHDFGEKRIVRTTTL